MKVLVTGGAGFIGRRLVRALLDEGKEVRVVTRGSCIPDSLKHFNSDLLKVVKADLLRPEQVSASLIEDCQVVFNCAGELHDPAKMEALHVNATARLIQGCQAEARRTGRPVHWVQLSSVGAYGPVQGRADSTRTVTEDTVPAPRGPYETTKTRADELVQNAGKEGNFSYAILRPSNVYGAGMPNSSLRQWAAMIRRGLFFYVGRDEAIATYVHVEDVVDALMLCAFDPRARGEIFNLSNDCLQSEMVNGIARELQAKRPKLRLPETPLRLVAGLFAPLGWFPLTHSRIDALVGRTRYPSDKLRTTFGFSPSRKVPDTVAEVFRPDKADSGK